MVNIIVNFIHHRIIAVAKQKKKTTANRATMNATIHDICLPHHCGGGYNERTVKIIERIDDARRRSVS